MDAHSSSQEGGLGTQPDRLKLFSQDSAGLWKEQLERQKTSKDLDVNMIGHVGHYTDNIDINRQTRGKSWENTAMHINDENICKQVRPDDSDLEFNMIENQFEPSFPEKDLTTFLHDTEELRHMKKIKEVAALSREESLNSRSSFQEGFVKEQPSLVTGQTDMSYSASNGDREDVESILLDKEKVVLIGLSDLKQRINYCEITLDITKGRVVLKGVVTNIRKCKLELFETINTFEECTKIISRGIANALSGKRGEKFLKQNLVKKKFQAVGSLKDLELRCLAFDRSTARAGLRTLEASVSSEEIPVLSSQSTCLTGKQWTGLSKHLCRQYLIDIECQKKSVLISGAATDIVIVKREVQNFLNQHTEPAQVVLPQDTTFQSAAAFPDKNLANVVSVSTGPPQTLQFQGAKARCLHEKFQKDIDKIKYFLRNNGGDLKVVLKTNSLTIEIIGGSDISKKGVAQIRDVETIVWHQKLQWMKIAKTAKEHSVVSRSLMGQTGKKFLKEFEDTHNCFIDVDQTQQQQKTGSEYQKTTPISPKIPVVKSAVVPAFQPDQTPVRSAVESSYRPQRSESLPDLLDLGENVDYDDDQDLIVQDFESQWSPQDMDRSSSPSVSSKNSVKRIQKLTVKNTKINLEQGDITDKTADTLVNVVGSSLNLDESIVAKTFLKVGGSNFKQCFESAAENFDRNSGSVIFSPSSDGLNCNMIFHMVLGRWRSMADDTKLSACVQECLDLCETWGSKHIAFPAAGCGRLLRYPPDVVADCLITCAIQAANSPHCNIKSVSLVVFDESLVKTFSQRLSQESGSDSVQNQYVMSLGMGAPDASAIGIPSNLIDFPIQAIRTATPDASANRQRQKRLNLTMDTPLFPAQQNVSNWGMIRNSNLERFLDNPNRMNRSNTDRFSHRRHQHENTPPTEGLRRFSDVESRRSYDRPKSAEKFSRRRQHDSSSPTDRTEYRHHRGKEYRPKSEDFSVLADVRVWAESKKVCEVACGELERLVKSKFLAREDIKNLCIQNLSENCIRKINHQGGQHGVGIKIKKDINTITVKGEQSDVTSCVKNIYQILLDNSKQQDESENQPHRHSQRSQFKRGTRDYWVHVAEFPEVPHYWHHFKHGASLFHVFRNLVGKSRFECVKVNQDVKSALADLINRTWRRDVVGKGRDAVGLSHKTVRVTGVERIENLDLYKKYSNKRAELFRKLADKGMTSFPAIESLPKSTGPVSTTKYISRLLMHDMYPEINEHYFFHGTKQDVVKTIMRQGIESRISDQRSMFGAGAYAAESPTKADQYADSKSQRTRGEKTMFLVRMLLGHPYLCTSTNPTKYRKAPCMKMNCLRDDCTQHSDMFDSVIGDANWLFREFVVYCTDQCYPEYMITYVRE